MFSYIEAWGGLRVSSGFAWQMSINIGEVGMRFLKAASIIMFFLSNDAFAYWMDAKGKVTSIITYAHTDTILVKLDVSGTEVPECSNKSDFAISKSIPEDRRAKMYALLLAAKMSGTPVTVSFNHSGECEPWDSKTSVYRTIKRLR